MRITVSANDLKSALRAVTGIAQASPSIPILSHIKLEARGDELEITATDLLIQIDMRIEAEVFAPGAITVPGRIMSAVMGKIAGGADVTMEHVPKRNCLRIAAAAVKFDMITLYPEDFPSVAAGAADYFDIDAKEFVRVLKAVKYAICTDATSYNLSGIRLEPLRAGMRTVATNRHLLAIAEMACDCGGFTPITIPGPAAVEMIKFLDQSRGPARLGISASTVELELDRCRMVSKLIDSTYPDWERVIPSGDPLMVVQMQRLPALACVDRVSSIQRSGCVALTAGSGALRMSCTNDRSADEGSDQIDAETCGPSSQVGFSAKYLTDILGQSTSDNIEMQLFDQARPALFRDGSSATRYVLMPMRV